MSRLSTPKQFLKLNINSDNKRCHFSEDELVLSEPKAIDWENLEIEESMLPLLINNIHRINWSSIDIIEDWMVKLFKNRVDIFNSILEQDVDYEIEFINEGGLYTFLDENINEIRWDCISFRKWMLPIIMKVPGNKFDWEYISMFLANEEYEWQLPFYIKNQEFIVWEEVEFYQEWILPLLIANTDKIDWEMINMDSYRRWMLPLLLARPENYDWYAYIENWMRPIFENNIDLIFWYNESFNYLTDEVVEWIVPLIIKTADRVPDEAWQNLSANKWAAPIFELYPDKVYWRRTDFKSANIEKIVEDNSINELYENPISRAILFNYDYDAIKSYNADIKRELIEYVFSPKKIQKWIENGNDIDKYLN